MTRNERPNKKKNRFESDVPDISSEGSPLDKVTQKDNIDLEELRKKRRRE